MTRSTYVRLAAAVLGLTVVIAVVMVNINWNGTAGSQEAGDIDHLLNVMIVLSSFVYSIVLVMLGYSIWRYRAKPGDESDGEPIHGNTRLEIAWTAIPTVIVLFGAAYSWVILDRIEAREPDRLQVDVTAQQFAWKFEYPDAKVTSTELHVPVDRQVEFSMQAIDVIHSFWVPEWRVKKDLVPGQTTHVTATPDLEGSFSLICTELCGIGHSTMRAPVVVESQQDFDAWLAKQSKAQGGAQQTGGGAVKQPSQEAQQGESLFAEQGCAGCHALAAAGSTATVGPNLDDVLPPDSAAQIEKSIVDPPPGVMPTNFGDSLDQQQLKALADYLVSSVQGGQ